MLSAALLHPGRTILHHCPKIRDVELMLEILKSLGCHVEWTEPADTLVIDAGNVKTGLVPEELAASMRSSVTLMGSLLSRVGSVCIPSHGGCVIGERPIDLHVSGLKMMGVSFSQEGNRIEAQCSRLFGACIDLRFPSVGATENLILASVLAKGDTRIRGAAREPEIVELCCFLNAMGASIEGAGTSVICIRGVKQLADVEYTVASDRIVAGTYLCALAACGGEILLKKAPVNHLGSVLHVLGRMGLRFETEPETIRAFAPGRCRGVRGVETGPYPGFPTDLQSPLIAAMCVARGWSNLTENIFEDRFQIVKDLECMGACIRTEGKQVFIKGVPSLKGEALYARELRGGAALCVAAAAAEGVSRIYGCRYIFRGYENVIGDLKNLGIVIH